MIIGKEIKRKLVKDFRDIRFAGAPPVLAFCLYDTLMNTVGVAFDISTVDVKVIMLVATFEGLNRWQMQERTGMYPASIYKIMKRLEANGYIYSKKAKGPRTIHMTAQGAKVVHEINRLWDDVIRTASKEAADY